tara:strand:- start:208 stop:1305 length:1098 start_codon:yes stop_codon:yes gene_type:complete
MVSPSFTPFSRYEGVYRGVNVSQYIGLASLLYMSIIRFFVALFHIVSAIYFLIRYSKNNDIRVIHAWHPLAGISSVIAAKITGRKVFLDWTDLYSEIVRHESSIMFPVAQWIEGFIAKNADLILTVSEKMKSIVVGFGASVDKVFVIPDGVDDEMFNPTIDGAELRNKLNLGDCPIAIFHGDIKFIDGVDILIRAFSLVLKELPNSKLLIVGGGRGYFSEVKKLSKDLGIKSSIIFMDWVPHRDIPKIIAAADVGVIPLRATLQTNSYLSFKIFEYWAMGKPVIVSNLISISTIAKNNINGLLVEPENIEKFAKALHTIFSNKEKGKILGKNGRIFVEKNYSWNTIMEQEALYYEKVLIRKNNNR